MMLNAKEELGKSLHTGFIDHEALSLERYQPKLLINNHKQGQKVLTSIIHELEKCDAFFMSVAFITNSGVVVLLNTLKELEKRGVKGKIVASQYLNFTEPKALSKLLSFSNIELRIVTHDDLHTKGYIFKKDDQYNLIVGSSNLTQKALSVNKEWNVKVSSTDKGSLIISTLAEFEKTFASSVPVDEAWIRTYKDIYKKARPNTLEIPDYGGLSVAVEVPDPDSYVLDVPMFTRIMPNKMQVAALEGIENIRKMGESKALLVSATGTGKTYLAAFDIAKFEPKRMLFLAHREQILNQSIDSFKNVIGTQVSMGKIGGGFYDLSAQYIFSTIQTMSKSDMLKQFHPETFDYIVIDESHRAGAESYQRIINHFNPKFLLGMTATPERTDDHNICKDFDYNIAYEIRLEQAMEEDMLCPFHYFGITDLAVDGEEISETTEFKYLVSSERVRHIIDMIEFYGFDGDVVKGLVFCSRNEEAQALSNAFNQLGYKTVALSGANSQMEREAAIERLEDEREAYHLDYIFTVDIFNEGVDIPHINQVVMLRPTKSAIIFVQQLGRGLRKARNKEYVVVLDFIGNYQNNFMIPIALSDDRSFNKDTIRRFVAEGSRVIPGCTTINFDAIAKRKIYESIDRVNFNSVNYIKDSYKNLKYRLGRIPTLMDFENHDSLDLARMFENNSLGSYYKFLVKHEKEYDIKLSPIQEKYLEFISKKLAIGKRPHELLVIRAILNQDQYILKTLISQLHGEYGIKLKDTTIKNVVNVLTNEFPTGGAKTTYQDCVFIKREGQAIVVSDEFCLALKDHAFSQMVAELVDFGLHRYKKYYGNPYKETSFQLYQKYSYEDVCRLLEWEQNIVSLNIGGYKYDANTKTYPVFINYHKEEDISDSIKYEDRFLSPSRLMAISKSKRTVDSPDIQNAYHAEDLGIDMELFVRKNKEDQGSKEFYYLGRMKAVDEPIPFVMAGSGLNAVELTYQLDTAVREDIYEYITEA